MPSVVIESSKHPRSGKHGLPKLPSERASSKSQHFNLLKATLVVLIFLVHGYHPFADDAALYGAGIKHILHPQLFSQLDLPFLEVHRRFSLFEPMAATLFRLLHLSTEWGLFLLQAAASWFYLAGIDRLTIHLFPSFKSRLMALLLSAACFALPIAGSGIFVMDPFITARSITTPLALFTLSAAIDDRFLLAGGLSLMAALVHPIMGLYLLLFVVLHFFVSTERWRLIGALLASSVVFFGVLYLFSLRQPVDLNYQALIWTRRYLFLAKWEWFEVMGLVAPLFLLLAVWILHRGTSTRSVLAMTCFLMGVLVLVNEVLFVHLNGSYFIARIQLLRAFQIIYLVGLVMLGGWLGRTAKGVLRPLYIVPLLVAAGMYFGQRADFPYTINVEAPGRTNSNPWHKAFLWLRQNTEPTDVVAVDPDIMEVVGEGHESPRPTSERSILASNKDGGVAVLSPSLTTMWTDQQHAQINLNTESDDLRISRLSRFHVSWLILSLSSPTAFHCPFSDVAVKVCQLPPF